MAALRTMVAYANNATRNHNVLLSWMSLVAVQSTREAHTQHLTKNIQYISNEKTKLIVDPKTMKLNKETNKPLCVIMNWMLQRPNHVTKYARLYLEQGFDVVSVSCTPWQLTWPLKGSQLIAADLIKFISENGHKPLVVHGFSVGAYVWSEGLVYAMKNKEKYMPVLDRVAAQIWDSAADVTEIPYGFPAAVFPNNKFMQNAMRVYIEYHLKKFHDAATMHYNNGSSAFISSACRAPALFLLSKTDPVGAERSNRNVYQSWLNLGIKCTWKCWDRSPHVQHYTYHKEEYLAALFDHLEMCNVLPQSAKARVRL
ncbi:uncharacterized protein LOC128199942 [Galleria mellonella]|uniref:Uncharacterized protein LOC128199942 n=1 Tax=Galleria mellonella TaxID=7137 RepID=A0A6J1WD99_GALME|nr:uncharacterized protein LOC128199942 [Galleria mellonella]XP_031765101.2 uncharacterized protein LOC128199942 [Galleria mellonella]